MPIDSNPPIPGWRIQRIIGKPTRRTEDDRMGLPLWLVKDGRHVADVELVISRQEAESLHAVLCHFLDEASPCGNEPIHPGPCTMGMG